MHCPKCSAENSPEASRCEACGHSLAVAVVEVVRGDVSDTIRFLRPRPYSIGRARDNDIVFNERRLEDARAARLPGRPLLRGGRRKPSRRLRERLEGDPGRAAPGGPDPAGQPDPEVLPAGVRGGHRSDGQAALGRTATAPVSLVQTLNTTLVLSQVLEQVLGAIVNITGAEDGFLLLADASSDASRYPAIGGLRLRVVRGRVDSAQATTGYGISAPIVTQALETGRVVTSPQQPTPRRGPTRACGSRASSAYLSLAPLRKPGDDDLPWCAWRRLRGQRGLCRALQLRRAPRGPGARAPRCAGDRERAALRARAAHDRGAAQDAEAAPAVREARHHRPDVGGHRPRAEHASHLYVWGTSSCSGSRS